MDTDTENRQTEASYESSADVQTQSDLVGYWLKSIRLAQCKTWLEQAEKARAIYTLTAKKVDEFNVLYANIQTICPAVYNQVPVPDVRRRYASGDNPVAKSVAQLIERVLSFVIDDPKFDSVIKADVLDCNLLGRGVSRLQYEPVLGDQEFGLDGRPMPPPIVAQTIRLQHVDYRDFVHDMRPCWDDVAWVAFRHRMTLDQLRMLNPDLADKVQLDCAVDGYEDGGDSKGAEADKSLFKRAVVWEVWDKARRKVIFIAQSMPDYVLAESDPPFTLDGFFPCPCPIYATNTGDLKPVVPFDYYRKQAEELNRITGRIMGLLKILKYRGVVTNGLGAAFAKISALEDGEFEPVDDPNDLTGNNGGIDRAVWTAPVERIITVLRELVVQREQTRQVIYEITGIADIMRGATNASETLGAQQIKAQWGALRLQSLQRDVQRYIRDFMRMMAEVVAENYEPHVLQEIAGIPVDMQMMALLRDGVARNYRIDVETDSTVRADAMRDQQNMTQFASGIAQFLTAVVPLAQQGAIPPSIPIVMTKAFARAFKLGREVEDALDGLQQQAETAQTQAAMPVQAMPQGNVVPMVGGGMV